MADLDSRAENVKRLLTAAFDKAAPTYAVIGPLFFDRLATRLVERAGLAPGSRVLDAATGTGAALVLAAERVGAAGHVLGVDLSEAMLAEARKRVDAARFGNVGLQRMDVERLECPDASFDHVLCGWGMFLFPRPDRALSEFHRVLRPSGRLALATPGRGFEAANLWIMDVIEKHWPKGVPVPERRPLCFTQKPDLAGALERAGFAQVEISDETQDVVFPSADDWWRFLNSISPRVYLDAIERARGKDALAALREELLARVREQETAGVFHLPTDQLVATAVR